MPEDDGIPATIEPMADPQDIPAETDLEVAPPSDDAFPTEDTEAKKVPAKKQQPQAQPHPVAIRNVGRGSSRAGGENLALYAPRPDYPYEARRQNAIGSGVAGLTIDSSTGLVTAVRMKRSTGNSILDAAAVKGFLRWKFRPGTAGIDVPITFTLTGASL